MENKKEIKNGNEMGESRKERNVFFLIGILLVGFLLVNLVSAAQLVCLTYGQTLPPNVSEEDAWKTCYHDQCVNICANDELTMHTNPDYCSGQSSCLSLGDTQVDGTAPNLIVNSPSNEEVFDSRKVLFDLVFNEPSTLYYLDNINGRGRWSRICSNCEDTYNMGISFKEGFNNITIRARDRNDNFADVIRVFRVDTHDPKVKKAYPTGGFGNGEFSVEFEELNLASVQLFYGMNNDFANDSISISEFCTSREDKYVCTYEKDLSAYEGEEIQYFFRVTDIAGNTDDSKEVDVNIDTTPPIIEDLNYHVDGKYLHIEAKVVESFLDEFGYSYVDSNGRVKEKKLCSRLINSVCKKKISFSDGEHSITFYAIDDVGHNVGQEISFFTDSKDPRIYRTYPSKGFASGLFEIEFAEMNPEELTLFYGFKGEYKSKNVNLLDCSFNKKYYCDIDVNIDEYNGEDIYYYFSLDDKVGNNDESKAIKLTVDISPPVLNNPDSFWEQGEGRYSKYIYFNLDVTEDNFDKISYLYFDSRGKPREKSLCSRLKDGKCVSRKYFAKGAHSLNMQISDEAGNAVSTELVEFEVL
jgi:hypothetical protein